MPMLEPQAVESTRHALAALPGPVNLVLFTRKDPRPESRQAVELLGEVAALSDRVTLESHEIRAAGSLAYRYGIEHTPGIVVESRRDYGIRYYGAPLGDELPTLLEVMVDVARGDAELAAPLRARLAGLARPIHIQVFTMPSCKSCPRTLRAAQRIAMVSDVVRVDAIDATAFPNLAVKHEVSRVPRALFNGGDPLIGPVSEGELLDHLLRLG